MGYFTPGSERGSGGGYFTRTPSPALQAFQVQADAKDEQDYTNRLNTNKKAFAQGIKRLMESGNLKEADRILKENRGVFSDKEIKDLGLDKIENAPAWAKEAADGKSDNPLGKVYNLGNTATGGGLGYALKGLDYGRAAGVGAFRQLEGGVGKALDAAPGIEVQGAESAKLGWGQFAKDVRERTGFGDYWQERKGDAAAEGDDTLFGSKALQDSKWVDRAVGLVGDVGLDPLTYVSFGGGSLAKSSLKSISAQFGDDMARTIRQHGLKGAVKKGLISDLEVEAIRNTLRREAETLVSSAAKRRSVRRLVEEAGEEGATDVLTDRAMGAVQASGRSGLRIGNPFSAGDKLTVIPSRPGGRSVPILQAKYADRVPAAVTQAADTAADAATPPAAAGALHPKDIRWNAGDPLGDNLDVLGPADDGRDLFVQVRDESALFPFERNPRRVSVQPGTDDASKAIQGGARKGNVPFTELKRGDRIPGVGVVKQVGDDGVLRIFPDPDVLPPGADNWTLFPEKQAARADLSKVPDMAEPFDEEAAQNVLRVAERVAPAGVDTVVEAMPGQFIYRDADGAAKGFLSIADGKVEEIFLDPAVRGQGISQRMFQAAEDAGIDIGALSADEFTAAGRAAQEAFLRGKGAPAPAAPALRGGASSDPVRRSLAGVLRESRPGQTLRQAFVPRTAIRDALGDTAADKVYRSVEQASAEAGRNVNDMLLQIGKVSDAAAKELRGGPGPALLAVAPDLADRTGYEAFNDLALGTLEGTLDSAAVKAALAEDGMENAAKALSAFEDVAARSGDALTAAKASPEGADTLFSEQRPGVARILTKEGETLARGDRSLGLAEILGVDSSQLRQGEDLSAAVNRSRPEGQLGKTYADLTVREVNTDLARRLGLPEDVKLFEDDAMAAVALRGKTSFDAAAQTHLYQSLAKETVDGKNPMMLTVPHGASPLKQAQIREQAEKAGYKRVKPHGKDPMVGESYAHPAVADEVARMQDLLINDKSLKQMGEFLQKWNGVWASYATVPLVFGTGFHSRNAIGNVILSFMGGLTNPARFGEAAEVQWAVGRTRALMKKEGISWEEALPKAVKSARVRQTVTDMRQHGIINNGFFADISGDEVENLLRHNSLKDWLNPAKIPARLGDNALIRTGRHLGSVVEDNARAALYLDAYAKTGSVQAAADTVKKYLFDYQDLTPFERRTMKSLNRFYTFSRKNLAVHLYTAAMDPWRIKAAVSAEQALYDQTATENTAMPDYARKGGYNISQFLGKPKGTEGVAMNIDTPLDNAVKTLDPIAQAVSLVPGIRRVVPPQYRSDKQTFAKSVLNLRAGGPVEMVNFLFEQATGKDTFSGKDISDEGAGDTFKRLTTVFSPLYSKGSNFVEKPYWEESLGMDLRLNLLKALVGIDVLPITDKQRNQVAYVGAQEAENIINRMREEGIDVPTYSELVAAGLAPDLSAPRDGKRRSPEEAAQARRDKINAARAAYGAAPVETEQPERRRSGGFFS